MNSKKNISQIVCWALTAPPVAGCSSQAASDSDAATRQQAQNDDIASSNPRLVEKIVARGSLFVARKSLLLFSDKLWPNLSSGLATCEPLQTYHYTRIGCDRVSQRDASLCCPFWQPSCAFRWSAPDGLKRLLGVPYAQGRGPCFFVACGPRSFFIACMRFRRGRPGGYSGGRPATR